MGMDAKNFVSDLRRPVSADRARDLTYKYLFKKIDPNQSFADNGARILQKMSAVENDIPVDRLEVVKKATQEVVTRIPLASAFQHEAVKACFRSAMARYPVL